MVTPLAVRSTPVGPEGAKNFLNYYTSSFWALDDRWFMYFSETSGRAVLRRYHPTERRDELRLDLSRWVAADEETREDELLNAVFLARTDRLILPLGNRLEVVDLGAGRLRTLHVGPAEIKFRGPLHVSADERYLVAGLYPAAKSDYRTVPARRPTPYLIYDLQTEKVAAEGVLELYADHFQFMPDGERILFAHEGAAETVPDRLNLLHWREGRMECIHAQETDAAGALIEYVGHEMVAGELVVAVRYPVSKTAQFGLLRVDPRTGRGGLIDADDYWHAASDERGEKYVMDTMWWGRSSRRAEHRSDIVLVEPGAGRKQVLASIASNVRSQAYHPHPRFNRRGDQVILVAQVDASREARAAHVLLLEW